MTLITISAPFLHIVNYRIGIIFIKSRINNFIYIRQYHFDCVVLFVHVTLPQTSNMSQLLSILDYYVNNETEKEDEVKQPVAANNNNTSAPASNTQITHVYPSLFSMWNPFPTINHHHHHHYSVNSNDNKDHKDDGSKNNTLLGTIIGLATAVAGYFSAGAWSKYNRVTEDLRKCEEINMRNLSTVGRQTEKLLTLYLLNRRWSLYLNFLLAAQGKAVPLFVVVSIATRSLRQDPMLEALATTE